MRRNRAFLACLPDVLLALFGAWLVASAFHAYESLRDLGPHATIQVQGRFGEGPASAGFVFVMNVLFATAISAFFVRSCWQSRSVILDAEVRPRAPRPSGGSARRLRRRKHRR